MPYAGYLNLGFDQWPRRYLDDSEGTELTPHVITRPIFPSGEAWGVGAGMGGEGFAGLVWHVLKGEVGPAYPDAEISGHAP
jgi:hypothetical protein